MDCLWMLVKWNQKLKSFLPASVVSFIRRLIETSAWIWKKQYFGQFGEDAVLQTIFREIEWKRALKCGTDASAKKGFYVDVGAFAPIQHSNTFWFYKHGWQGINIDATPGSMRLFNRVRRRDVNLELAVSDSPNAITYYTWGVPNVANTTSKERADKTSRDLGQPPVIVKVRALTLQSIFDEYLQNKQSIDLMNVDVEGHNLAVLKSNNWKLYRPLIVAVESDNDEQDIAAVLKSELHQFMEGQNYGLCAWIRPTLIYELRNKPEVRGADLPNK